MNRDHPILGKIRWTEENPDDFKAEIIFEGRTIPVSMDPDDRSPEEMLAFAAAVVTALERLEPEMKAIAVRDLRPKYNDGWNEYDEQQDDGTYKTVKNPKLTEEEFAAKLSLSGINVTGDECFEFWYDDSGLFWGHRVMAQSLDGLDLSKADAQIFG